MRTKEPKPKKGFMDGYKTYDPSVEGYGNPDQWKSSFFDRLGIDKAIEVLGESDPLVILGVTELDPTWDDVSRAYRRMVLKWHPDRNPDNLDEAIRMAKQIIAAFEVLEHRYGVR